MRFASGEMGAVNGMAPDGTIITSNEQVREVWTGTTFSVAALMLADGLKNEGYRTAGRVPRRLREQGILVPITRGLRDRWQFSCFDVHAPGRDLGDGDDRATFRGAGHTGTFLRDAVSGRASDINRIRQAGCNRFNSAEETGADFALPNLRRAQPHPSLHLNFSGTASIQEDGQFRR